MSEETNKKLLSPKAGTAASSSIEGMFILQIKYF
jgi:hypothetical protein